ncbi:MAG: hypothetical protein RL571_1243 [Pseudomonadota bacterium]|jgi:hypothetical protein
MDVRSDWKIKNNKKKIGDLLVRFSVFIEEKTTVEEVKAEGGDEESIVVLDSILSPIKQQ